MAEYGSMFLVSALAAILFFGGWNGPIPLFEILAGAFGWEAWPTVGVLGYLAALAGCANLILKAVIGVTVMIWVRWTLPRLRIDQVITMCWKYCVPIAAVCFVGVLGWRHQGMITGREIAPSVERSAVRENWVEAEPMSETDSPDTEADEVVAMRGTK